MVESGRNKSQESDSAGERIPVEKEKYISRKEFDEVVDSLQKWTKDLVENLEFCPNCGIFLYLHCQGHARHSTPGFYKCVEEGSGVFGEGGCYHLECPRCGYYVNLEQPK